MATGHKVYSDLLHLSNFITNTAVSQGKNLLIDTLREYFRQDTFYKYRTDAFGFPLTPNLTDMPPNIQEERTTRIFIGDVFRYDKRFWPAIVIKYSSGRTYHVSFNQEHTTKYRLDLVVDGYGNKSYIHVPTHHVMAGAWEQTFEVLIAAESIPDREELTDIVASFLIGKSRQELYEAGLFVKNVSLGSEREEDWGNDKVYIQSITVETFSEWRIEIPINDLVQMINMCFTYNLMDPNSSVVDNTFVGLEDIVEDEI
jgi:hypothetical protein